MKPDEAVRVRLRTPADVVDAVPYLVGFRPDDSVVVVSLRGGRRRVGVVARLDLPPLESVDRCASDIVGYLRRDRAREVLVVFYPAVQGCSHPVVRPLLGSLEQCTASAGIRLADALCVADGRWWSLHCADPGCCSPDGTPIGAGGSSVVAAAFTLEGRVVLGSREELERTIAPVAGPVAAAMDDALPAAVQRFRRRLASSRPRVVVRDAVRELRAEVECRLPGAALEAAAAGCGGAPRASRRPPLAAGDAARLIAALGHVRVRDEVLTWWEGDVGAAAQELLAELVRLARPPYEAPALTTLAWLAYLRGEGALAGISLERALGADPGYRLAGILATALQGGLGPDAVRAALPAPKAAGLAWSGE